MADRLPFALAWLRQRESGSAAVAAIAAIEAEALRGLDADEALSLSEALLAATPLEAAEATRGTWSGVAEQQRLFARASQFAISDGASITTCSAEDLIVHSAG